MCHFPFATVLHGLVKMVLWCRCWWTLILCAFAQLPT
jgi:hypothetical protein